jgi:protein SCO1/2
MKPTAITIAMLATTLAGAALLPPAHAGNQTAHQVHAAHAANAPAAWQPAATASTIAIPPGSIYQLATPLTDAAGQRFTLRAMAGAPLLVTMFYGDCHAACPVVIETLKRTVTALGPEGKRLRILLISLDPKRDTPQSLGMMAGMQHLDPAQYRLAVARDDSDTRMLASALNIRFRALDNGEISHTTRIALLNADGSVQADSTRLAVEPDPDFVKQITIALKR